MMTTAETVLRHPQLLGISVSHSFELREII